MTASIDQLALEVIHTLDEKLQKAGTKNNSYAFGYQVSRETIKAVAAQVVAHYQPKGYICRLDLNPNSEGVRARLRITKA